MNSLPAALESFVPASTCPVAFAASLCVVQIPFEGMERLKRFLLGSAGIQMGDVGRQGVYAMGCTEASNG